MLLLSSYGNEFSYFSQVVTDFRSELDRIEGRSCDYYQVALELARFDSDAYQAPFVDYVNAIVAQRRPELVVTLGGPAARFGQMHRERLFPDVPLLYAAVDSQLQDMSKLSPLDSIVPLAIDLAAAPEAALQLLPDTRNLAIILGSSPLERYWRTRLKGELARFESSAEAHLAGRVDSRSDNRASRRPAAALGSLSRDAPRRRQWSGVLAESRPRRGPRGSQGARFRHLRHSSRWGNRRRTSGADEGDQSPDCRGGGAAARGHAPRRHPVGTHPGDDRRLRWARARALEHSGESTSRGAEVRFRTVSPWRQYRLPILAGSVALVLQSMLIVALLAQRARRREAECEVRALHGRLLTTYEQERRRLARELHDDVTQRLARLAIDAAQLERQEPRLPAASGRWAACARSSCT